LGNSVETADRIARVRLQKRHTVARWSSVVSLSRRLALFVGLIVIGVVASVAYLEMQVYDREIDRDIVRSARLGGQSAADALADRPDPLDARDVRDTLHDLIEADPLIDAMSVLEVDGSGVLHVLTSTSTEERAEILDVARQALASGEASSDRGSVVMYAVPVPRHPHYAVAVTVGLETLLQARAHGLWVALGFAIPTILLVTLFVHLTVRHFVALPLRGLLRTMTATGEGVLSARAAVLRTDELGTIATGLNAMLDQLEGFQRSLQDRIDEATRDLSQRNAQLAASHEALFAVRESLAQAERVAALGQVAASVAHQAGTPLNLVSGYVQMIRDDPATDERVRTRLQTVDRQIQQVARVLRSLLDSARAPSGFERVAVTDIIERLHEVSQPRLSRAHIALKTSVADGLPMIRADVTQLEMALLNLVNNALDAMPGGGTLHVSAAARDEGGVHIEIADSGPGIPSTVLARLFDLWVTTKPAGRGSGLGLAIVRDVVRAHGGSVSAYNRVEGAVFVIDLPASDLPAAVA
jgi:signal transduction histidine kinase